MLKNERIANIPHQVNLLNKVLLSLLSAGTNSPADIFERDLEQLVNNHKLIQFQAGAPSNVFDQVHASSNEFHPQRRKRRITQKSISPVSQRKTNSITESITTIPDYLYYSNINVIAIGNSIFKKIKKTGAAKAVDNDYETVQLRRFSQGLLKE